VPVFRLGKMAGLYGVASKSAAALMSFVSSLWAQTCRRNRTAPVATPIVQAACISETLITIHKMTGFLAQDHNMDFTPNRISHTRRSCALLSY